MIRDLFFVGQLMFLYLFLADIVRSEKAHPGYEKACAFVQCDIGEHCVSRKFWCKNPPCPSMLYCSKTPRESMKGPMTCASVRCSKGHICMVKVRRCRWDQGCKQQIARCVSKREYYEGPASCADFNCASGHKCILRESLCAYPPCKLLKSCANAKDMQAWHARCRTLGCPSEYECFLRRPSDNCVSANSCKHTPDCTVINVKDVPANPQCRGWVCPRDQQCLATSSELCSSEDGVEGCKVNRTCHGPLATLDTASSPSARLIPRSNRHPSLSTEQTTPSIPEAGHSPTRSQTNCSLNVRTVHINWDVQFEKWNSRNGSLYQTPVYVRSTLTGNGSDVGESPSQEQPIDNLTTQWLDYLRLKTGMNAIDVWIKQAEENGKYEQFNEWLAAVRSNLGPSRFNKWLREIRKLTSEYPAFQKWLAPIEAVPSLPESHSDDQNDLEKKILAVFPDQGEKPDFDNKRTQETAESPDHGYRTLTDFYPRVVSENDRTLFSIIKETPNGPLRKNAGHPRINYGRNRDYKLHREFHPPERKTQIITESKVNDSSSRPQSQLENTHKSDTKMGHFDLPELKEKVFNHSLQLDLRNDGYEQQNANDARNDLTLDSAFDLVAKLPKNIWNDTRVQENSQENDTRNRNPLSNAVVGEEEDPHDLITEDKDDQVRNGFGNLRPESRDQIGNRNELDHNLLLFTKVKDSKWNSGLGRTLVPTVTTPFTVEDQREPSNGLEFPVSSRRQYYQRVYELDPRVPEGLVKSRNSWSDIETRKDEHLTKTYTLSSPAPEELHIISPWDAVRVLDPRKRAYFSLLGFAPEQTNDRLRVGYPLVMLRTSSLDRAQIFPQDAENLVDISMNSKSGTDPNSWNQIFHYQPITRRPASSISQMDRFNLGEQKQVNDLSSQPKHQGHTAQQSFFEEEGMDLPVRSHSTGLTELKESLKEHRDPMSSEEYLDAYVKALIEDALSRVILGEQLRVGESPGNWENSGNSREFFKNTLTPLNNEFKEEHLDIIHEIPFPEKNVFRDEKDGILDVPEFVQLTEDVSSIETQVTTTPAQNLWADLTIGETNDLYGCEDGDNDPSGPIEHEETNSALDEVHEYYHEDTEQEYSEGLLGYEDEYPGNFETNLTDYDFQYYGDKDYDKVSSRAVD